MKHVLLLIGMVMNVLMVSAQRTTIDFNKGWKFMLADATSYKNTDFNDAAWRRLDLPHDWSIEGRFNAANPAGNAGGALPGGVGWYRKTFSLPETGEQRRVYLQFDGIYRNSEVWINGQYLGKWPYGYTAFQYELTSYLKKGNQKNVIAVRVDNAQQPNSRWYSGSGIYRDVRLVITRQVALEHWGVFVTTPEVTRGRALVNVAATLHEAVPVPVLIVNKIYDSKGVLVAHSNARLATQERVSLQKLPVNNPELWSVDHPALYRLVTQVYAGALLTDTDTTSFGIRYFNFNAKSGFSLNGDHLKIQGVCLHHDLGALGAAFNRSAARRQLQRLKDMGCNAIRTAHNPPAAAFLDLCDEMGFLVMDESFDMWAKKKNKYDYSGDFLKWHQRDLEHMVKRDRNHPAVFIWSIGNEIREQFDSTGITLAKELVHIVKSLDTTRPVTCALSENDPAKNFIYQSKALDVVGLNYHIEAYEDFPKNFPDEKFIATENVSGLATRGHYDLPADSLRYWPPSSKFKYVPEGNADYTVSAYDNVAAYWGSTHEQTWRIIKKHDYLSGLFVWSGFDFLGEPVPYPYPARSSYYGIIDLAGFPKDVYYMYQSEWTKKTVLHIAPHWNWRKGQNVDVKIYYNNADEVELFLNGRSLGKKTKPDTAFHVLWKVPYEPGMLKAVSYKKGSRVLERTIRTAGTPARIEATVENPNIRLAANELAYITIRILDREGNLVPDAGNEVAVTTGANAEVIAMDNGYQADQEPFRAPQRKAYNGMALAIVKGLKKGTATITVTAKGMQRATVSVSIQ
ncbi:glycoside hydrolase [Niabella ginsenosidivorans]|uniref:Glycoside hydrolase n=1 Tax=Niabella ginsenosidivorans TaxID=1176587 RepID=A0A1A9HZL4_9BACT|nr:glycoside hydrolase family 2 TIM barrel-domain containing protein [Niabella ginsenosidivorans]ANH80259.1 glycoside hydrolase [Niabella ginsenosidivorans]